MQQYGTAGFEQILVDKRHDRDVALSASTGGNNRVIVIDDLLQSTDSHGTSAKSINVRSFGGCAILGRSWLQTCLVCHKFCRREVKE
jgi:hypothetical protein